MGAILQTTLLGIVQGVTEFLPISSSAHLAVIPWAFGMQEMTLAFDVALHFGTLLAIGVFFFKDWIELLKAGYGNLRGNKTKTGNMFWFLVAATIPGGIIGFILQHYFEDFFRTNFVLIGIALIVVGIVMYLADKKAKSDIKFEDLTLKQTLIIGCSQALAFITGVSRSGATITAGRMLGIDRESAAKFSFLLATPITLGAFLAHIPDIKAMGDELIPCIIGIVVSFIVGLFVIKFLMQYLRKGSFKIFAIYRVIIGVAIIGWFFIR